ncbi:MAG: hypothetical protein Q7R33_00370 [Nitrosarchaeum sp.]|nr:hypothetical protein [Nitrosarchaeum sp.]
MQYDRVNQEDIDAVSKFDFVVSNANGIGINVPTPSIVNYVSISTPVVLYNHFVVGTEFDQGPNPSCHNDWPLIDQPENEDWFLHGIFDNQRMESLTW